MKEVKGVGGVGGGGEGGRGVGGGLAANTQKNGEISLQLDVTVLGKRSGLTE